MYQGTDHVFEGRSLNELIDDLAKARPAATALSENAAGYERLSGVLGDIQARLRAAMNVAQVVHQGVAAEASQDHTGRQLAYADEATTEASAAKGSVTAQSQHYSDTVARMPRPAEEPAVWRALTVPLDPSHSYLVEQATYDESQQAAIDAMNSYQASTNDNVRSFALFAEPTMVPAKVGPASGSDSPGFPGSGGGQAPGTPSASIGVGATGGSTPTGSAAAGVPPVPQQLAPPVGSGAFGPRTAPRETTPARPTPGLTPLRPRAAVPGAWNDGGLAPREAGRPAGPGGRPGTGTATDGSGTRATTAGRGAGVGNGFMPMGAGAGRGRGDDERRRPAWLLEDDPEAAFGPMPPHAPPVIEASDHWDPR
jgi:hypothetical protein